MNNVSASNVFELTGPDIAGSDLLLSGFKSKLYWLSAQPPAADSLHNTKQ